MTKNEKLISWKIVISGLMVYTLLIILYGIVVFYVFRDGKYEIPQAGLFGDMFGGFNSFFTGLAFLAVSLTLYLQIRDMEDTKVTSYNIQVENSFFNMLTILNQIIDFAKVDTVESGIKVTKSGRESFHTAFEALKRTYSSHIIPVKQNIFNKYILEGYQGEYSEFIFNPDDLRPHLEQVYEIFYEKHHYIFGHYFRYIYNIMKYIKNSFPTDVELQNKYIGILQAQMSNDELGLIFYNALSKHGRNSRGLDIFRIWLDQHNMFQNIAQQCIFEECYTSYYKGTTFKYHYQEI